MNDGSRRAAPGEGAGPGGVPVLAEAVRCTENALGEVRAARTVEWAAPAADLYRAQVDEALHGLVQDRQLLDDAVRQAGADQAVVPLTIDGGR